MARPGPSTAPPGHAQARNDRDARLKNDIIPTETAPAHNYVLAVDFQGDDIWVATAKGLSHGVRIK